MVRGGHLCVYMFPTSPKANDLRLDGRYALHTAVEDNAGTGGEFLVRGNAYAMQETLSATEMGQVGVPVRDGYVVFDLLIDVASAGTYEGGAPRRSRWRT
jgi:hypothetical protein